MEELEKAVEFIKARDINSGIKILVDLIKKEPKNETVWFLLATCIPEIDKKRFCLQKVLEINPENQNASQLLASMDTEPLSKKSSGVSVDNTINYGSNFVKLIPANCPNCGGTLQISANTKVTECPYCGHNVIIQDPTRISVEKNVDVDKLLKLAGISEESRNYQDAYTYYSQIIEYEPENVEAWLGKGFTAGMLSSENNIRVKEASNYTHQAFELLNKLGLQIDNNLKNLTIRRLDLIAKILSIYLPSTLYQELINMGLKGVAFQPYQGYLDALILAWEYDPSKEKTEHLAFEISSLIRCGKLIDITFQNAVYEYQRSQNISNLMIAYYKEALQKVRFSDIARKWDKNFDLNKIFGSQ